MLPIRVYSGNIYFVGMSGPGSLENLKELLGPIHGYFNGIIWLLHDCKGSEEEKYLETIKQENGKIIHYTYHGRHDVSRNHIFWLGGIKNGDWVVGCDELERVNPEFCDILDSQIIGNCIDNNIKIVYFEGKPLLYEFHESLVWRGTPHEGLLRQDGSGIAIDFSQLNIPNLYPRTNMRPIKRDKYHFIDGYMRYMLLPWGSNNSALGLEKRQNGKSYNDAYIEREKNRLKFLSYLDKHGYDRKIGDVKKLFSITPMDSELKEIINNELIFIHFYRFHILGERDIIDNHDFNGRKLI